MSSSRLSAGLKSSSPSTAPAPLAKAAKGRDRLTPSLPAPPLQPTARESDADAQQENYCFRCFDGLLLQNQAEKIAHLAQALEIRQATQALEIDRLRHANSDLQRRLDEAQAAMQQVTAAQTSAMSTVPCGSPLLKVYFDIGNGFNEEHSKVALLRQGAPSSYNMAIPSAALKQPIRIDIGDAPGLYCVTSISLQTLGNVFWLCEGASLKETCTVAGTAELLDFSERFKVWATGDDPQIIIHPPVAHSEEHVLLRIIAGYETAVSFQALLAEARDKFVETEAPAENPEPPSVRASTIELLRLCKHKLTG